MYRLRNDITRGFPLKLKLTPEVVAAAYELLRTTAPFKGWYLPPSEAIKFRVTRSRKHSAQCDGVSIEVSEHSHGHLVTLLSTVAHEMIHLYESMKEGRPDPKHGALFHRRAALVCRLHGFDPKAFP